jgi:transcriptional regulator with XRE-family HTH domain
MTRLTNPRFAELTGCDFTSASKIRNGHRRPSLELFMRMMIVFNVDANDAVDAWKRGPRAFTDFLNEMIFEPAGDPEPVKFVDPDVR